ncbi:MAG: glycoside hydrolase family 2 protein [Bacteroidales bacterium]|nr:glycoside hydrolase family 2 protein [Bacteroidales bacterium]
MYNSIRLLYFIAFSLVISSCSFEESSHRIISLNNNWEFTSEIYNQTYPAIIPGSIHTDLFQNNLILDPFSGENENYLQWIDTLMWIYTTEFKKPDGLKSDEGLEIIFKGLDTYADVYLNDSLLFSANNMFVPWKIKIDPNQLKIKNTLSVKLKPAIKEELKLYKNLSFELPEGSRAYTRKAAYHYGWDWGPKYITSGIWQNVELHIWNTARIKELNYSIQNLDSSVAKVNIHVSLESEKDFKGTLKLNSTNQEINYSIEDITIKKGIHDYNIPVEIKKPKLWWTHNLGVPFLYKFEAQLIENKQIFDSKKINIGLRTIELIREPDDFGESFYFKLNGIPVFMKGANYIPLSSFPGNVKDIQYNKIISDAVNANMNMLRVWGGGIYEKDIFYDLCDKEGILIWQDFMFANNMFPNDSMFLENIKNEAEFQVNRLKKHPSIAVWCGNNEIDEAWHNWGWSNSYSKKDSAELWNNYVDIFHKILPEIIKENSPEISYTSSSPLFGRGNSRSSTEGDNHYWYVWHDAYDFDWYNKVTGRFMSEFGFQSFPSIETIEYFDTSVNKSIDSEVMLVHQKHHKGNFLINHYMKDYYPVPENFEDFIYISQLLQAEGIRTGILAQRRAKPFCMGSLYWQLNDCWPAISWSSIDYSGNWKALHYFAKDDFKNIIIDPYLNKDSLEIFIVSDSLKNLDIDLRLSLMNFEGEIKHIKSYQSVIPKNSSKLVYKKAISEILNHADLNKYFLFIELSHNKKILDSRHVYFTKQKDLELTKFEIDTKIKPISGGFEIRLKTKSLIKNLYIQVPIKGQWSENYFDLLPNIEKRITFRTEVEIKNITDKMTYNSLNQILTNK